MTNTNFVMEGKPKIGGAAFKAPRGTALPTNCATVLAPAYIEQGYVSDEGVKETTKIDRATQTAWGGDEILNSRKSYAKTVTVTLVESLNPNVVKTQYGDQNVTVTPATVSTGQKIAIVDTGFESGPGVWVFDMDSEGKMRRVVYPNAKNTTDSVEVVYKDGETIAYQVQLSCYRDASGVYKYEYTDDGVTTA